MAWRSAVPRDQVSAPHTHCLLSAPILNKQTPFLSQTQSLKAALAGSYAGTSPTLNMGEQSQQQVLLASPNGSGPSLPLTVRDLDQFSQTDCEVLLSQVQPLVGIEVK